ncbi:hypothetical protein DFAR_1650016 [Desulfarculales bacterium]
MEPPSSDFKSWSSCTPSLSFREAPSQSYPSSWPARIISSVSLKDMQAYLLHHLKIVGVKQNLFFDQAVIAIQRGGHTVRARVRAWGLV